MPTTASTRAAARRSTLRSGLLYPICTGEKGRLEAKITKMGRSGPRLAAVGADNPVPTLAEVIDKIVAYEPEIDVSHPFFREVLEALGVEQAPNAENIDRIADELAETATRRWRTPSRRPRG